MEELWWPTIPSTGPEIPAFEEGPPMQPLRMTRSSERCADQQFFPDVVYVGSHHCYVVWMMALVRIVCDDSWRGPIRTHTAGCTKGGTAGTSLMKGSPMEPAGTLCPKVG